MKKNKIVESIGTGRRKTAVASVRLRPGGSGVINVNGRTFDGYFPLDIQRDIVLSPMRKLGLSEGTYDIIVRIKGGGPEGQAVATRHGLARALEIEHDERRADLKAAGFLTRDARKRERKKYGQRGARRGFQFSKR